MSGFKDNLNKDCGTPVVSQQVGGGSIGDASTLNGRNGAYYLDRSNHTGSIDIEDVDGLEPLLDNKADLDSDGKVPLSQIPDIPAPTIEWDDVDNKPTEFTPSYHTHPLQEIDGLMDGAFIDSSLLPPEEAVEWDDIDNKPLEFPPTAHTHTIPEVDGLNDTLSDILNDLEDAVTDAELTPLLEDKADKVHTHVISDVTGLQGELDDKVDESDTTDVATAGKVVKYSNIGAVNTVNPQFPENAVNLSYLNAQDYVDTTTLNNLNYIQESQKGSANGVAELDGSGKILSNQLPSYVDDVLSYPTQGDFPAVGETGKIYIAEDVNLTYRWTGSAYVEISPSIALGETSSTAYRGDRGKIAYDHTLVNGNPHNTQIADIPTLSTNLSNLQNQINDKVDKVTGQGLSDENYTLAEKNKLASIDGEWYGTRADYEAITSPNPNIKYFIEKE